ncbi:putative MFS family arabinose efflux permease [Branchiibius hedensis]|uniref:Predicted arabinose efflux permease, MFS family n=1 Tax=Branchiibius hedensis TaxID=672460 RepID=A0A2Y8ZR82_9MICO|nr:MFS transporter [Branchiibius hedensis]PWJ25033.1 putative MFS family arabinose efflux permease [Branchiibius hedensis]SSA33848.1 Predicted arabinose efflux permease, MFS family [Branchiibius hedensis]
MPARVPITESNRSGTSTHQDISARHAMGLAALLGLFTGIQGADPGIASTALLTSSRALHMDPATQALASSISTLMLAATVISTGLLADRLGRKRVLLGALLLAALGDAVAAAAMNPAMFLIGRAIAGIALGAVFGSSFAYLRTVTPEGKLGAAMGVFSGAGGVVPVLSGYVGGYLIAVNWRLAFLIIPVLSVLAFVAALVFLPTVPKISGGPLDVMGQATLALGIVAMLYGFSHAPAGASSPLTWGPLLGGILLLVGFLVRGHRIAHSFFPMSLLRNPGFLAAVCIGFGFNLFQGVGVLQVGNLWQFVDGWSTFTVALAFVPMTLLSIAASVLLGGLSFERSTLIAGIASVASCLAFAAVLVSRNYLAILPALLLMGIGFAGLVPYGSLILKIAPPESFGVVTSSRTTIGQFGYSVGLAGGMVLLDAITGNRVTHDLVKQGVTPPDLGEALTAVHKYTQFGSTPAGQNGQALVTVAHDAYRSAFVVTMTVTALVIAALTAMALVAHRRWVAARVATASS